MKENFYAMPIAWQEKYERVRLERAREQEAPQGKDTGKPVHQTGGEDTAKNSMEPIREMEKKDLHQIENSVTSGLSSGTQR